LHLLLGVGGLDVLGGEGHLLGEGLLLLACLVELLLLGWVGVLLLG
jgi:hypothetical protein